MSFLAKTFNRKPRMIAVKANKIGQVKSFLIGPLVPLTIFFTLLKSSGYTYLAPEVIVALAMIVLLGAALGLIIVFSPLSVKIGIYSCLVAVAANGLFRPFPTLDWLATEALWGFELHNVEHEWVYPLAIFCVSGVLLSIVRRKSEEILFVVFLVLLLSSFFITSRPTEWQLEVHDITIDQKTNLPPYIHIVLDGHIGLEGVPKEFDPTENFKYFIEKSYSDLGYKVYGNVTVPARKTIISFRNFLNFVDENDAENVTTLPDQGHNFLDGTNALFSSLDSMGYSINVIQSAHLDLCHSPGAEFRVRTCRTYPFSPVFDSLMGSSIGPVDRATAMVNVLFRRTGIAEIIDRAAESNLGQKIGFPRWPVYVCLYCISAFTALSEFDETMLEIKRGEAYFIHLMAPHEPYQFYDENCDMIFPFKLQASSVTNDFSRFLGQATCTQLKLRKILVKLAEDEATRDAVVIIHGDHGPPAYSLSVRYVPYDPNSEDYGQAAYSTFFAARAPKLVPEYDRNPYNLSVLLEDVFKSNVVNQSTR